MLDPKKFKRELALQGMTLAELHNRSGLNYGHLVNIKNGNVKLVKMETLMSIARHLNNTPPYLLMRDSILNLACQEIRDSMESLPKEQWPSYLQETLEDSQHSSVQVKRFPIIGHVRENGEHDLPEVANISDFSKGPYNTVPFDHINDPDAYAVISTDRALSPDVREGSVLLLAPKAKVDNLSLCLVRTIAGNRVWVRYVASCEDTFILLTRGEITKPITVGSKDVAYIHRCVGRIFVENP